MGLPGDVLRDNERGTGVADPEHPSVELLAQISGFPTTLVYKNAKQISKAQRIRIKQGPERDREIEGILKSSGWEFGYWTTEIVIRQVPDDPIYSKHKNKHPFRNYSTCCTHVPISRTKDDVKLKNKQTNTVIIILTRKQGRGFWLKTREKAQTSYCCSASCSHYTTHDKNNNIGGC